MYVRYIKQQAVPTRSGCMATCILVQLKESCACYQKMIYRPLPQAHARRAGNEQLTW